MSGEHLFFGYIIGVSEDYYDNFVFKIPAEDDDYIEKIYKEIENTVSIYKDMIENSLAIIKNEDRIEMMFISFCEFR